jgi:endonuclease/exonuclease/phosphatase family metal-dependent hydrolase
VKKALGNSRIIRMILIIINLLIILAYLLTCLVPFADPIKFWFLSFLGLAFPFFAFALMGFTIYFFIIKSGWAWFSLFTLLIGFQQLTAVFAFHLPKKFVQSKSLNTLRILQYNVMGQEFVENSRIKNNSFNYQKTLSFIKETNADVITFQEYSTRLTDKNSSVPVFDSLGYPYHYFAVTENMSKIQYDGVAIFSKFPIVGDETILLGSYEPAQDMIYADVKKDGKIFRIFSIHLQSIAIGDSHYTYPNEDEYGRKSAALIVNRPIAGKIKRTYDIHYQQSRMVREKINQSPHPIILGGDFNAVPNSHAYFTIKGNLQDAFLKKGTFLGKTFRYISPTLRIDYVLADPSFTVSQFTVPHIKFSDHFPVIADLQYR